MIIYQNTFLIFLCLNFLKFHIHLIFMQHAKKENAKEDKIRKEAKLISEEIAHRFNLKTIRFMAYTLSKIVRRLFRHIYVNKEGVAEVSMLTF